LNKTILIFGAGQNQLTLIKAANELGLKAVVIDPNHDAPGKEMADIFEVVEPNDYEATKKIAIKYNVDGIVTSQMENPLRLMAKLAEEMGYIFPSVETIEKTRNKFLMKKAFQANNIPCAKGLLIPEDQEITQEALQSFKYPLIIKPADAHSSRGVFCIKSFNELLRYRDITQNYASDKSVIIEEFIEGNELSIEAITYQGETHVIQYTQKIITDFPHTVELGHMQPANLSDTQKEAIDEVVSKAIGAFGIENSATHTELKLTLEGPKIIEIGARLGGDFISSYLTLSSTGVNMDKAAIQVALGQQPELDATRNNFSFIQYLQLQPNQKVCKVDDWRDILKEDGVVTAGLNIKTGYVISPIEHSALRPGYVLVQGVSKSDVEQKANLNLSRLKNKIYF